MLAQLLRVLDEIIYIAVLRKLQSSEHMWSIHALFSTPQRLKHPPSPLVERFLPTVAPGHGQNTVSTSLCLQGTAGS